jgi:hypothetical protein
MIADGGTINCSGKCNKINLTMGEYVMNSLMIASKQFQWIVSNFNGIFCNQAECDGVKSQSENAIRYEGVNKA